MKKDTVICAQNVNCIQKDTNFSISEKSIQIHTKKCNSFYFVLNNFIFYTIFTFSIILYNIRNYQKNVYKKIKKIKKLARNMLYILCRL